MAQRLNTSWQEASKSATEAEYKSFRPQVIKGKGKPGVTRSYSPADIRRQIERELVRIAAPEGLNALRTYNAGVGLASDYPSDFPEFRPTLTMRSSQRIVLSGTSTSLRSAPSDCQTAGQDTEIIQALYSQHNLQAFCLLARCLAELTPQEIARSYNAAGYAALWGLYKRRNGIVWE